MPEPDLGFEFGDFRVLPGRRRLERRGNAVPLGSRAFDLLLALLARQGELATKDDLLAAVWGDRTVEENNLTVHIAALRRALGDGLDGARIIVTDPGRGYRFVTTARTVRDVIPHAPDAPRTARDPPQAHPRSLLIRPFGVLGDDPAQRIFAEDLTAGLVIELARLPDSLVHAGPPAAGGVRYIVDGTARWADGVARTAVRLLDAAGGVILWADRFDHRTEVPGLEAAEVTSRVARALNFELVDREARQPLLAHPAAVDLTMRGWSALQRTLLHPKDLREAREWFGRALQVEPGHPTSLAGLSYAIAGEYGRRWNGTGPMDLIEAEDLASRAVAQAPDWPLAWFCRGFAQLWQHRYEAALACFERALAMDPCHPLPHAYTGYLHLLAGRVEEMLPPLRRAMSLSPRDRAIGLWHHWIGLHDFWLGRYEDAVQSFLRATDLAPRLGFALGFLASAFAWCGRLDEARVALADLALLPASERPSIRRFRAEAFSSHPVYLAGRERFYEGLRLAGVPEE